MELPSAVGASDGSRQTRGFVSPRLRDNSDADELLHVQTAAHPDLVTSVQKVLVFFPEQ